MGIIQDLYTLYERNFEIKIRILNGVIITMEPLDMLMMFFLVVVLIDSLIGNTLVIVAIMMKRYLRNITNTFIACIAFYDIVLAVIYNPTNAFHARGRQTIVDLMTDNTTSPKVALAKWAIFSEQCKAVQGMLLFGIVGQMSTIFLLALDRTIASFLPLKYDSWKDKSWLVTLSVCFGVLIVPFVTILYTLRRIRDLTLSFGTPCLSVYALDSGYLENTWIPLMAITGFMIVLFMAKFMANLWVHGCTKDTVPQRDPNEPAAPNGQPQAGPSNGHVNNEMSQKLRLVKEQLNISKPVATIMIMFTVTYLAYFSVYDTSGARIPEYKKWGLYVTLWVWYINICGKHMVYLKFGEDFRRAFKDMLSCCWSSNNEVVPNNVNPEQLHGAGLY